MPTFPTYSIKWNATGDTAAPIGSFLNFGVAGTKASDVLAFSISRGIGDVFTGLQPGECEIVLDNFAGAYSPANATSSYYNVLRPGVQVYIYGEVTGEVGADLEHELFFGSIDEIRVRPELDAPRQVTIRCRDGLKFLQDKTITTSMFISYNIGSLASAVLSLCNIRGDVGFSEFTQAVDDINDVTVFASFDRREALGVLQEIAEAGGYKSYVDGAGVVRFRNRYFDQEGAAAASYNNFFSMDYARSDESVYNRIQITGQPRERSSSVSTLAWVTTPVEITASAGVGFFLTYLDPTNSEPVFADTMVLPVNSSDYTTNTQSGGGGTDRTATTSASVTFFGGSAVCSLFNGSGDTVYLNKFQVRGQPIQRKPNITVEVNDSSSQLVYGLKAFSFENNLIAEQFFLEDYADFIRLRNREPSDALSVVIRNDFSDIAGAVRMVSFELAQLIHIREPDNLGINGLYSIRGLEHSVQFNEAGWIHEVKLDLDAFRDQKNLILDHATFGVLDGDRQLGF